MQESIDMAELLGDLDFDPAALKAKYRRARQTPARRRQRAICRGDREFSHYVDDPYVEPGFSRAPLHDEVEVAIRRRFWRTLMAAGLREAGFDDIRMIKKAILAAPGIGIAIQVRCAMWSLTAICRCLKNSITCRSTSTPSRRRFCSTASALRVITTYTKTRVYKLRSPN